MPRAKVNKLYRTFVKGLITEASYLTYPEDASIGELNTILSRKGNRTRRLGLDYETGYQINPADIQPKEAVNEHVWKAVDNKPLHFMVLQLGMFLYFYELDTAPVSDSRRSFTVNLGTYKSAGTTDNDVAINRCQFSNGSGYLFVAHPFIEPLLIEYDTDTNVLTTTPIVIQIRDFEGVYDGLANDQEPTELTPEHHYNLSNQGWNTPGTQGTPAPGTTNPSYIDPYTGHPQEYDRNLDRLQQEIEV